MPTTFSLQTVVLICFAAIASIIAAVMLVMRDLAIGTPATRVPEKSLRDLRLRRPPADVPDEARASLSARFDAWFDRLIFDTGLELGPISAFLCAILVGLVLGGGVFLWTDNVPGAAAGMVAGIGLTLIAFMLVRARRFNKIREQMPEVVEQIGRAVRAGESVDQAFAVAARRMRPPLASEFRRCTRQLELGISLPAALRSFQQRVRVMDIQIFVTTLTIHRESGGNLPLTLERMANMMRERLSYRRQIRANTATGRLTAVLLGMASPLMFLYYAVFRTSTLQMALYDPFGQLLLGTALVLEIVGLIWIYAVTRDLGY
jgi:tight adherence protein B